MKIQPRPVYTLDASTWMRLLGNIVSMRIETNLETAVISLAITTGRTVDQYQLACNGNPAAAFRVLGPSC